VKSAASQVQDQIVQMMKFIKQEAEEKASEIKVSAEEVRTLLSSDVASGNPSLEAFRPTEYLAHCAGV
jgi:hypothetical protein